ncbi:polyprotein [hepatovirus D2]|uniref:Genome polyprotein n=1 Tax=hepatovirus D2 TaxID=2766974 RepID=A0A0S1M389_9PICO|nr:polyprotein [hepatovirus D2]
MMSKQGIFQSVGEGLDHILSLADMEEEQMIQSVDRTAVAGASYFTSVDQSSVHSAEVGSHQEEKLLTSVDLPGSKKTQGEKFFLIHSADWNTTDALFHEVAKLNVVNLLYDQQYAVQGLLRYHTYGRFGVEVQIQINPTPFQQGGLICAMVPGDQGYGSISCLTVYPHGLLNCNINNVVRIKVPFIYTRGAYNFREPQYPVWELTIRVWSLLNIGTGTTPYCSVNVLARFTDLELHGLTPIMSQMMRNEFRVSSTDNVINLSNYEDARAKISFALDQENFLGDSSEGGGIEIKHFSTWTRIPTLAAQFSFNASATVGTQIQVFPVDPYFYTILNSSPDQKCITSLASVCQMFCFWRGDIVFDFQVFPTKYHSGRLLFCFVPGNENMDVSNITLKQATTGPCAVMDITGVQSTLRFRVPWISDTPYRVNRYTKSAHVKGEYTAIGKLIVFVYNRLASPSNVASHVRVNVYMSAINLECFAPVYHAMTNTVVQAGDESGGFSTTMTTEQNVPDQQGGITSPKDLKGRANRGKMDLSATQAPVGAVTTIEDPLLAKKIPETFPEMKPGQSRHTSDHMLIHKFMGRGHFLNTFTFNSNNMEYTIPITLSASQNPPQGLPSTLRWFFNMFQLYRGPLDLTIIITGATDVDGLVWFTPVGLAVDTPWTEKASLLSIDYKSSLGAVRFNTRRTGNIQVRLPWYSYLYAVSGALDGVGDASDSTFGLISIQITNYNSSDEYLSFSLYLSVTEQSQFYFPRAPLNTNAMAVQGSTGINLQEMLESAVDEPRDEEDFKFERCIESRKPIRYKDLRLEIGPDRIKAAYDDLNQLKGLQITQAGGRLWFWKKDSKLTLDFSFSKMNAEPKVVRTMGFSINSSGPIYHLAYDGARFLGNFSIVEKNEDWIPIPVPLEIERILTKFVFYDEFARIDFGTDFEDLDRMCERVMNLDTFQETTAMRISELKTLMLFLKPRALDLTEKMIGDSGLKELSESGKSFLDEAKTFLSSIKNGLKNLVIGFSKSLTLKIIRSVLLIFRCGYLITVHAKMIERGQYDIAEMLRIMNWMDLGISAIDFGTAFSDFITTLLEFKNGDDDGKVVSQSISSWLRDISSSINIFKNVKDAVIWLYNKIKDYYDTHYGWKRNLLEALKENEYRIENILEQSDAFCVNQIQDVNKQEEYERGVAMIKTLRTVMTLAQVDEGLKKHLQPLRDAITRVHSKLKSLGAINQAMVTRCEPVVCYLFGKRGGGKSLASLALATKICKSYGVDPKKNIYTKPVSSSYWDGYAGQLVCIIDDIGQNTSDEDWGDFCQLVSGCPMRLNMASLEDKGRHFSSPFIICTSNWSDPSPKTVYVKAAIERRLHYKVEVKPKDMYRNQCDDTLNVNMAKSAGTIADMSCLELTCRNSNITLDVLVDSLVQSVKTRESNMNEFMDLWSQSGGLDEYDSENLVSIELSKKLDEVDDGSKCKFPRLHKFFNCIKNHKWYTLGAALGILGVVVGGWYAYKVYKDKHSEESIVVPAEGVYHGVSRPKHVIKLDADPATSQSTLEVAALVRKNLVQFGIGEKGGTVKWVMNALGIKDDWLLVPSHAYKFEPNYETLEFFFQRNGTYYSISAGNVVIHSLDVGFQDVVLMRVPTIPKFRDITDHFISRKDLDRATARLATLITTVGGTPMMISEGPLKLEEKASYHHKSEDGTLTELTVDMAWRGKGEGIAGMCGGALITSNQSIQNAIVGLHVAGGGNVMVSKVITKEMLANINSAKIESQRITKVEFTQCNVNVVSKTLLKKSPIHHHIDKQMINYPAVMPYQKNVEIDPMAVMLSKYALPLVSEPPRYNEVVTFYKNKILGKPFLYTETFSLEQAIVGVEGMEGINMKSSAGFPYVHEKLDKSDLIWFSDDGSLIGIHPRLRQRLEFNLAMVDNGNDLDVVYVTCPKDELRPIQKVLESKTRAIDACPLDFVLICRMFWGPAISYFQLNPGFHTGVAVGIDPDRDWDPLFKTMIRFGDYGIDLDFSSFDASLSPFMIYSACEVLSELSGVGEFQNRSLANTIIYSKHQITNLTYHVIGSMPSGSPCTSLLNSIVNNLNLFYVFWQIFGKRPVEFYDRIKFLCYGDDVIIVFSRDLEIKNIEKLGLKLQEQFRLLGMTATSGTKQEPRVVPIQELSFLKRKFLLIEDRFRPAIDPKTIWSMIAWIRSGAEFKQNLDTACWFAFMHGRDFYYSFTLQLKMMLEKEMVDYVLKPYEWWRIRFESLDFVRDLD